MIGKNSLESPGRAFPRGSPCFRAAAKWYLAAAVTIVWVTGLVVPNAAQAADTTEGFAPSIRAADVFALQQSCSSTAALEESLQLTRKHALSGPGLKAGKTLAFEEHPLFIYTLGDASKAGDGDSRPAKRTPRLVRRFFFLKPATFVIDDLVRAPDSGKTVRWRLDSSSTPEITGRRINVAEGDRELVCETLPLADSAKVRFLRVLHVRGRGDRQSAARSKLVEKDGELSLTVSTAEHVFQLALPPETRTAGRIAVSKPDGETLLARRPLPSGVLPHGPEGVRLLKRWDSAYHGDGRPGWDTGRPSSNLKKAVEDDTLRPCRAVVLGCGTGTNAIYLAGKGFDVTGIDIAPTALTRAEEKARQAGVKVRWLLADVLAPPGLEPFELIFDRGCYHGVRRQNAAGYVKAVSRLSQTGTQLLILAGNANESRHYGPPRVKEEEIRGDFSAAFDLRWLRETQFDTMDPNGKGALAWSVLLRRK